MSDGRPLIVAWANWFANNKLTHPFVYSEGSNRMEAINQWPLQFPVTSDCSSFVTLVYNLSGCADPNGMNYDHEGYTGTLTTHGTEIPLAKVQPGDVIVYGPGTGWHTAIVVVAGPNPLTVSMGQNGDPSFVHVSQDGRTPQRYFRYVTKSVNLARNPSSIPTHPSHGLPTPPKK